MQLIKRCLHHIARNLAAHHVSINVLLAKSPVKSVATTAYLLDFSRWGTKKANRKLKIHLALDMADPKIEEVLAPLRTSVKEQVSAIWFVKWFVRVHMLLMILNGHIHIEQK